MRNDIYRCLYLSSYENPLSHINLWRQKNQSYNKMVIELYSGHFYVMPWNTMASDVLKVYVNVSRGEVIPDLDRNHYKRKHTLALGSTLIFFKSPQKVHGWSSSALPLYWVGQLSGRHTWLVLCKRCWYKHKDSVCSVWFIYTKSTCILSQFCKPDS